MKLLDKLLNIKNKLDNYDSLKEQLTESKNKLPNELIYNLELAVEKRQHKLTELQNKYDKIIQQQKDLPEIICKNCRAKYQQWIKSNVKSNELCSNIFCEKRGQDIYISEVEK
jgi:hypothetical protein